MFSNPWMVEMAAPGQSAGSREIGSTVMSMIRGSAQSSPDVRRQQFDRLIRQYGPPLEYYLLQYGRVPPDQAEDLVHEFLIAKLLKPAPEDNLVSRFLQSQQKLPNRRFRDYLRRSMLNFLRDQQRRPSLKATGLDHLENFVPLDESARPPDEEYSVEWASNLLRLAINAMRRECEEKGQLDVWEVFELRVLMPARTGHPAVSFEELCSGGRFGTPRQAVNLLQTAIRKLNRVMRQLIVDYIPVCSETQAAAVEEEFREVQAILKDRGGLRLANVLSRSMALPTAMILRSECERGASKLFRLEIPGQHVIGSETGVAVVLDAATGVSARHAVLILTNVTSRIVDLDSDEGTFVNGRNIEVAALQDGDQIRCGKVHLSVRLLGSIPSAPSAASGLAPTLTSVQTPCEANNTELATLTIPGYTDIEEIGRGAMGIVYRAVQLGTNRKVAIKCIHPERRVDEHIRQLFLREANVLLKLQHRRIVQCLSFGLAQMNPYLLMEFVETEGLEQLVWKHAPARRVRLAVKVILQVLEALEYAHQAGVVHRDIKPSNILGSLKKGKLHLKISDFGLAKFYETSGYSGISFSGDICGSIPYMSLEQLLDSRSVGPECDVYAAVVCLYRLLTCEYPFISGTPAEAVQRRLTEKIRPAESFNPEIPVELVRIIERGLSRVAKQRFATAQSLYDVLAGVELSEKYTV